MQPSNSLFVKLYNKAAQWPTLVTVAALLLAYGCYLPFSGYEQLYYDAAGYWWLAGQYFATGKFALASAASPLRGYLMPLLLAPLTRLTNSGWTPIALTRILGTIIAVLLWGAAIPALWRAAQGPTAPVVRLGRRLLLAAVGWLLWRDYFNFPLTDFPALLLFSTGLWALLRGRSIGVGLLAGAALAGAVNFRPVFLAGLPFAAALACWPIFQATGLGRWRAGKLALGTILGATLLFAPQLWLNATAFHHPTPFVLGGQEDGSNLYVDQISWGLTNQKYESNIGTDFPSHQMHFRDPAGEALLSSTGQERFDTFGEYIGVAIQHPFVMAGVYGRHLFNGLDVQYATPYIKAVFVPTWGLAWLNYSLLLGGGWVLGRRKWPCFKLAKMPLLLALAALLMPCLASIPVAMECRYLLPLHLILLTALVYGARPLIWWREAKWMQLLKLTVVYVTVIVACFALSANAQLQLEPIGRRLFEWQAPMPKPW